MPRESKTAKQKIMAAVKKYGDEVFMLEHSGNGDHLFCRPCGKIICHDDASRIKQHVGCQAHTGAVSEPADQTNEHRTTVDLTDDHRAKRLKHDPITSALSDNATAERRANEFKRELCAALVASDIPLWKLTNETLRNFLCKWTKMDVPDESTLRKIYVEPVYSAKFCTATSRRCTAGTFALAALASAETCRFLVIVPVIVRCDCPFA
jgi:hypothetical protein